MNIIKKNKKKKKIGFTIIELLAVIVVLAIIALIATPIVLNIIKDSKDSATLRSAENYMDGVANAIARENMKQGGTFSPTECRIKDGNLKCDDKETIISDEKGNLVYGETDLQTTLCKAIAPIEQPLWNIDSRKMESKVVGVQATKGAEYASGAVYSCILDDVKKTFYVLEEDGDNVELIMSENLEGKQNRCESPVSDGHCYGYSIFDYLEIKKSEWTKLAQVGGAAKIFDGSTMYPPEWLRINLAEGEGYWTSWHYYSYPNTYYYAMAYNVTDEMSLVAPTKEYGIRPVIVVPKTEMSL